MALEEFCAKQTNEIMQLNRLVDSLCHLPTTISVFSFCHCVCDCFPMLFVGTAIHE